MKRTSLQRKTPLTARSPMQKRRRKPSKATQKDTRWRSERYLAFVRSLPCVFCRLGPCDPHHVIGLPWSLSGAGLTAPDSYAMPLCRIHHRAVHADPGLQRQQPGWLIDTLNRGLDHFTGDEIVGELIKALEFVAEKEHQPWA